MDDRPDFAYLLHRMRYALAALTVLFAVACSKQNESAPSPAVAPSAEQETEGEQPVQGTEGDPDEVVAVSVSSATTSGGAGLIAEATHVLETMTASSYSHKTHVAGTVYDVDCSGFVDYLLARVDTPALAELRAATVKRPLAKHFVQFLSAESAKQHFQRVLRIQDLAAGDIVAWDKPEDVTSSNTGHVMIVSAAATLRNDNSWLIPIVDSSAAAHGKDDARKRLHTTGIGRGTIVLDADASGAPIAYRWSELRSSRRHTTKIVLGRVL
jgi:hypothetical protein